MLLTLVLVIPATLLGLMRGGSLASLAQTSLRGLPLVFAGVLAQLLLLLFVPPDGVSEAAAGAILVVSSLAVAVMFFLNRELPGTRIALVGVLLNMLVIGMNGGMPISPRAAEIAGIHKPLNQLDAEHEELNSRTRLGWLGDVLPFPRIQLVVSVGDVLLAAGIARLVYSQTLRESRAPDAA